MDSLVVTDDAVSMPCFSPLYRDDKSEIMEHAKRSAPTKPPLPYEDCRTIFTPRHPVTKPKLEDIKAKAGWRHKNCFSRHRKDSTFTVTLHLWIGSVCGIIPRIPDHRIFFVLAFPLLRITGILDIL